MQLRLDLSYWEFLVTFVVLLLLCCFCCCRLNPFWVVIDCSIVQLFSVSNACGDCELTLTVYSDIYILVEAARLRWASIAMERRKKMTFPRWHWWHFHTNNVRAMHGSPYTFSVKLKWQTVNFWVFAACYSTEAYLHTSLPRGHSTVGVPKRCGGFVVINLIEISCVTCLSWSLTSCTVDKACCG